MRRGDFDTLRSSSSCSFCPSESLAVVANLPLDSFWKFWLFCFVFHSQPSVTPLPWQSPPSLALAASSGLGCLGIEDLARVSVVLIVLINLLEKYDSQGPRSGDASSLQKFVPAQVGLGRSRVKETTRYRSSCARSSRDHARRAGSQYTLPPHHTITRTSRGPEARARSNIPVAHPQCVMPALCPSQPFLPSLIMQDDTTRRNKMQDLDIPATRSGCFYSNLHAAWVPRFMMMSTAKLLSLGEEIEAKARGLGACDDDDDDGRGVLARPLSKHASALLT